MLYYIHMPPYYTIMRKKSEMKTRIETCCIIEERKKHKPCVHHLSSSLYINYRDCFWMSTIFVYLLWYLLGNINNIIIIQ